MLLQRDDETPHDDPALIVWRRGVLAFLVLVLLCASLTACFVAAPPSDALPPFTITATDDHVA